MSDPDLAAVPPLLGLVNGFRVTQAIHVTVTLGIPDLLAAGARSCDELAELTDSHAPSLYRLLRALATVGVMYEDDDRRFSLTELGTGLRSDVPGSIAGWAAYAGRPYIWAAWSALLHSVRTGENAFEHVFGEDVWSYRERFQEESAIFDAAMRSNTERANRGLLESYDFGRFGTVVDVGGGSGALLAALLAAYPGLEGVLFDRPHVVAGSAEILAGAGVADRCRVVGGSFFESVPADGDAYLLKEIVHDWEDEQAAAILQACRRSMPDTATLLVVDRIVGPPNEDAVTKFVDLTMLIGPGGRERTRVEFAELFAVSGFRLERVVTSAAGFAVIEGSPVEGG